MTRYIKIPKPSPYFLFVLTLVLVLTGFGVAGFIIGGNVAREIVEAGEQETMRAGDHDHHGGRRVVRQR
jgi:hypothetical protein